MVVMVIKVRRDLREHKVLVDLVVIKVRREIREHKVLVDLVVIKVRKVKQVLDRHQLLQQLKQLVAPQPLTIFKQL